MKRSVTLKEIADHLGIARTTVSNAYNRPDQLSASLRDRILATAAEFGYVGPNPAARHLRKGNSQTIGVLYSSPLSYAFTDPAAALFLQGIASEVEQEDYTLLLAGGSVSNTTNQAVVSATTVNVDGFIVYCLADNDLLLKSVFARQLPTVMVDNLNVEDYPAVTVADAAGAQAAAEHLLQLGHQQFGVISLELTPEACGDLVDSERQAKIQYAVSRERLKGYRTAIQAAGLVWEQCVTVMESRDNTLAEGRVMAAKLFEQATPPTAILAMSDRLALGALVEAQARGIRVPDRLSIVGFDNIAEAAQSTPALTTIHQDHVEKGRQAGRLILQWLQQGTKADSIILETKLVVRASSATPYHRS